jgi:hypothetical protein
VVWLRWAIEDKLLKDLIKEWLGCLWRLFAWDRTLNPSEKWWGREGEGGAREEEICSSSLTHLRRKEFCAAKKYNPHTQNIAS